MQPSLIDPIPAAPNGADAASARTVGEGATKGLLHAKVDLLRAQLDPDFLFNTLNSLSGLLLSGRIVEADRLVLSLATYLRAPSGADEPAFIPLEREAAIAGALLEIEALRMDRPGSVTVTLQPVAADRGAPCLILLPLVEALTIQARDAAPAVCEIHLSGRVEGMDTLVELEQRFDRPASLGTHRFQDAIKPLSQRLSMMYGSTDRLEIVLGADRLTARLRLPAE